MHLQGERDQTNRAYPYAPPRHTREQALETELHREMLRIAFPRRRGAARTWRSRHLGRYTMLKLEHMMRQRHFLSRLMNYRACARERFAASRVSYLPPSIQVETGKVCCLSCPGCLVGRKNVRRERVSRAARPTGLAQMKALIDAVSERAFQVYLHCHGEPLLNGDFFAACAHAADRGLWTGIHSNLVPRVRDLSTRLINCGLNNLVVSVDGATQETYQIYRRGGDLGRVLARIRALADLKARRRWPYPWITAKFLVFDKILWRQPTEPDATVT